MDFDFTNKVVIVTGGTRGIGFETVKAFKERNATVILFGSRKETVDKAIKEFSDLNLKVEGYYPNLNNYNEVNTAISLIASKYGHIDIIINNAGMSASKPIEQTSIEEYNSLINVNLNGVYYMCKAATPYLKKSKGVILNTSSVVSICGQTSGVEYPTSKFAVNGLTLSLARELAPFGIRVNAVAPGITNTDMVSSLPKEMIDPLIKSIPLGRMGEPRDIANAFLFLASDMASYITGEVLSVDGMKRV